MRLPLRDFVLSARISADGRRLEDGMLGGTIDPVELRSALEELSCLGVTASEAWLADYADIASSGVKGDACDRISFGFGFSATRVTLGGVVPGEPPPACW
jgi:hypothetical protein